MLSQVVRHGLVDPRRKSDHTLSSLGTTSKREQRFEAALHIQPRLVLNFNMAMSLKRGSTTTQFSSMTSYSSQSHISPHTVSFLAHILLLARHEHASGLKLHLPSAAFNL
jgi:hypothetical protein